MSTPTYPELYRQSLAGWPVPVRELDLQTPQGTTHVLAAGPDDGPPVVLLPGGGATATVWGPVAGELVAAGCRVLAVDPVGDAGLSRPHGPGVRTQLRRGHRAAPGPRGARPGRATGAAGPDRCGRRVVRGLRPARRPPPAGALAGPGPVAGVLGDRRPDPRRGLARPLCGRRHPAPPGGAHPAPVCQQLQALDVPTLVVVAHLSLAHDSARVAARFRERWPAARVEVLLGASHHTLPRIPARELDALLTPFLAG